VNLASFLDWVVEALDVVLAGLMACGACLALACLFFGGGARRGNDASRRRSHES
jgi:hypothetical protein